MLYQSRSNSLPIYLDLSVPFKTHKWLLNPLKVPEWIGTLELQPCEAFALMRRLTASHAPANSGSLVPRSFPLAVTPAMERNPVVPRLAVLISSMLLCIPVDPPLSLQKQPHKTRLVQNPNVKSSITTGFAYG
jgi:hypothetical protein